MGQLPWVPPLGVRENETIKASYSISMSKSFMLKHLFMFKSAQWPRSWLKEFVTPLAKIPQPESEDDLRPISLTNFFSKVAEKFVVE